jgi:hypothetical protein
MGMYIHTEIPSQAPMIFHLDSQWHRGIDLATKTTAKPGLPDGLFSNQKFQFG